MAIRADDALAETTALLTKIARLERLRPRIEVVCGVLSTLACVGAIVVIIATAESHTMLTSAGACLLGFASFGFLINVGRLFETRRELDRLRSEAIGLLVDVGGMPREEALRIGDDTPWALMKFLDDLRAAARRELTRMRG